MRQKLFKGYGFAPFIFRMLVAVAIFAVGVFYAYKFYSSSRKLPFYNPSDIDSVLVDSKMRAVRKYHKVGDFELVDQYGRHITRKIFSGKICVVDFFFVSCPGICVPMAKNMRRVQDYFSQDKSIVMLSHTVNPEEDSVAVLRAYAKEKGAQKDKWYITTGDKKEIYRLARKVYFAATSKGDGGPEDFIHTENFVLVDPNGRLRGFYDGTKPTEIDRLIDDITVLENEFDLLD